MKQITTESGAVYLWDGDRIKRHNPDSTRRGDNEWLKLQETPQFTVGLPTQLLLEPLAKRGPDSHGYRVPDANYTFRYTTPVVSIEEVPA